MIDRISEDIDLVIDREDLGFGGNHDPTAPAITNKERERRIGALKQAAADFVGGQLSDALRQRFAAVLGTPATWSVEAEVSNIDNTLILFRYPTVEAPSSYLRSSPSTPTWPRR